MAGLRVRGSGREGLVVAALLIGALAAVKGDTILANLSPFFVQVFDTTTPFPAIAMAPNSSFRMLWEEDETGVVPDSRRIYLMYYPVAPLFVNDTQSSGTKTIFASTYISNNATIEFWEPTGSQNIAVVVKYP